MINCVITSSVKKDIYKNIKSIKIPAFLGEMEILPSHAESFVALKKGNIVLRQLDNKEINIQIDNGICYINDNIVKIIL